MNNTSGAIFLLNEDQSLTELREQPYESEDLLQRLLAQHPTLMPGDQMNREAALRWLLVRREAGVPAGVNQSDRWSMDHLFLDQSGVPTIVEVKRSSDTRLRREVVGQMLDYAANAVLHWPADRIRSMFEENCSSAGIEPQAALASLLESDGEDTTSAEAFWQNVERNLQARKIRMVFVADVIPPELQRIVEFLNEQMRPAEVLAVEVRQYVGQGPRMLVPRVYGITAGAQMQKQSTAVSVDEDSLLATMSDEHGAAIREFLGGCRAAGLNIFWGTVGCSIRLNARERKSPLSIAWVNPPGRPGWYGLTDVTLGVDASSLELTSPHLLDAAREYVDQLAVIPGAGNIVGKSMLARVFTPSAFTTSHRQITETVRNAVQSFK